MSSTAGPLCPPADLGEAVRINSFALVTYIPDPLGEFLDSLRKELVPSCSLRSHVSILPPRPLFHTEQQARSQIERECLRSPRFRIQAGGIKVFPVTNVIYIEIVTGEKELRRMHDSLNSRSLAYKEPHCYHPHITLAQQLPADRIGEGNELATRRWAEYRHERGFEVDAITFVQNTDLNRWIDLSEIPMGPRTG
jgi:2'-5' RNA ligase